MHVTFWGTRGSLAKPGPDTLRYGGNTSCIEVRSKSGTLVVIDCGTGAHGLGQALMATAGEQPVDGHLLISHTHWDHIQGVPFFAPLFLPSNTWHLYAPQSLSQSIRDTLAGQMQYTYFPITLEDLGANITYHDLVEGSFMVGDIRVRCRYLNHPALTLGYRLEVDGAVLVYACDHEPLSDQTGSAFLGERDQRHVEFLRDADLVIHDAQYTAQEYPDKVGWGHSTGEFALAACQAAGVKRLAITHYDPNRKDDAVDTILAQLRSTAATMDAAPEVLAAQEGQSLDLLGTRTAPDSPDKVDFDSTLVLAPAIDAQRILLCATDPASASTVARACDAENLHLDQVHSLSAALAAIAGGVDGIRPSLVLVDDSSNLADTLAICQHIQAQATPEEPQAPIVVLTDRRSQDSPLHAVATDWVTRPFTEQYARTRLRAWLLRTTARWVRAGKSTGEQQRLEAVRNSGLLDSAPEERFDRITRMAAAAFDVPTALITLVDEDRQWFKSRAGLDATETPRDMAFCAHAILGEEVLVVPDALLDPRFADNPLVTGPSRVRFYAGCPVRLPDGQPLGSLCVLDVRPRLLDPARVQLLTDLAQLVETELAQTAPATGQAG